MDSAAPQAASIGSLLRPAYPCKGLDEANYVVLRVSLSPETISSAPFPQGRAKPPIHHAVKFVAVYDDRTNPHAVLNNDSC
jgi:hypothetical protein